MLKKRHFIFAISILLPFINLVLYIPCGMYQAKVIQIGISGISVDMPDFLRTAYDLRLYLRLISGILLFLWGMALVHCNSLTIRKGISTSTLILFLLVRISTWVAPDWIFAYLEMCISDLYIWTAFSFCACLYTWLAPWVKKQASDKDPNR